MSDATSSRPRVLVIGAGMAGLAAADYISKQGVPVTILEARGRAGGRIHTIKGPSDRPWPFPIDLGASWVHGTVGNPLTDLSKDLGIDLELAEMGKTSLFRERKGMLEEERAEKIGFAVFASLFHDARIAAQECPLVEPPASLGNYLFGDDTPVKRYLDDEQDRLDAISLLKSFTGWTGADFDLVSFPYWGFERAIQGPDLQLVNGYGHIVDALVKQIESRGGQILFDHAVKEIKRVEGEKEELIVSSHTKGDMRAPYVVCTLPLGVLKTGGVQFDPPLPPRRSLAIRNLGMGILDKIVLRYDEAWWSECDALAILPESNGGIFLPGSKQSQAVFFLTGHNRSPSLVAYIGGSSAEALAKLSDSEAIAWAHSVACAASPEARRFQPLHESLVTRWNADPYSRGSYAYLPAKTGASPLDFIELSRPLWNQSLGFAGEHTEVDHYASVHGALISGLREGKRVMDSITAAAMEAG